MAERSTREDFFWMIPKDAPLVTRSTGEAEQAHGTCPLCGYWNHPDATVREAGDGLTYCNCCGHVWQESGC